MGRRVASRANTMASSSAQGTATNHPSSEIPPFGAMLAGIRNTPEPIMLPATSMVARNRPIRWPGEFIAPNPPEASRFG